MTSSWDRLSGEPDTEDVLAEWGYPPLWSVTDPDAPSPLQQQERNPNE